MTDTPSSYGTDHAKLVIPVIRVNGEDIDTEGLRHNYSALCHQVVTACDSGRTLEEGVRAYREHQQVKVEELQELMKDCSLMDCD